MSHGVTDPPLTIAIYDWQFNRLGWIADPLSVTCTLRHNAVSTAQVVTSHDHYRLDVLAANGARAVVEYEDQPVMSGRIRTREGDSGPPGFATFQVIGDLRLLRQVLGWPVPTSPVASQGQEHDVRSGTAESVIKGYVTANMVNRLAMPVTVAANQGRGSTVTARLRFQPLADVLPIVDPAGIGVTIEQFGSGLLMDVYATSTYPRALSEQGATVHNWTWSSADPEMTRVVVGGQGDGTARVFRSVVNSSRETAWHDIYEGFADARDLDTTTELDERGGEILAENGPTAGLSLTLSESQGFRFGEHIRLGDTIPVELANGVTVTDVLREVAINWSRDNGLVITPSVGDRTDDPDVILVRAVADLARRVRQVMSN